MFSKVKKGRLFLSVESHESPLSADLLLTLNIRDITHFAKKYLQHESFVVPRTPTARLALRRLFSFLVRESRSDQVDLDERTEHTGRRPNQRVRSDHCWSQ